MVCDCLVCYQVLNVQVGDSSHQPHPSFPSRAHTAPVRIPGLCAGCGCSSSDVRERRAGLRDPALTFLAVLYPVTRGLALLPSWAVSSLRTGDSVSRCCVTCKARSHSSKISQLGSSEGLEMWRFVPQGTLAAYLAPLYTSEDALPRLRYRHLLGNYCNEKSRGTMTDGGAFLSCSVNSLLSWTS